MRVVVRSWFKRISPRRVAAQGAVVWCVMLPRALPAQHETAIVLRLSPRLGDTLHTWLDQQMEVSASTPGGLSAPPRNVTTSMTIRSRTIVQSVQSTGAIVLTLVDSARVSSTDTHAAAQATQTQRMLEGQQLMLQIGADGSVETVRSARAAVMSPEAMPSLASMPAIFPRTAVKVGGEWTREMPLPAGGHFGASGSGHARAVFHLDSIRRSGAVAYVSMRGVIVPDSARQGVELSGSIGGTMQLDRVRGWMTDSRFVVLVRSIVRPPLETGMMPMQFITRVTQRLRTMDKR